MLDQPLRRGTRAMTPGGFFSAQSIAVVGASVEPGRIGGRTLEALRRHWLPRDPGRRLIPIHPRAEAIQGLPAAPRLTAVDGGVDLAVIAVPAAHVPGVIDDCAEAGCRAAVVLSSGFAEMGADGARLQDDLRDRAARHGVRVLGPNCLGVIDVGQGLFATFSGAAAHDGFLPGGLGIASQSGAVMSQMMMLARARQVGLSRAISTGNEADVGLAEALRHLVDDPSTRVILVYCEAARDGAALFDALMHAHRHGKPVLVLKAGATESGRRAALSHTGALAGEDRVFDAVLRQTGALRVHSFAEAISVAAVAGRFAPRSRPRFAAVTISGGAGVMIADAAEAAGLDLAPLPAATSEALGAALPLASLGNPLDTTAQVVNDFAQFARAVGIMLGGGYDALLVYLAFYGLSDRVFPALLEAMAELPAAAAGPIVLCGLTSPDNACAATAAGFLCFEDPHEAVAALAGWAKLPAGPQAVLPVATTTAAAMALPDGPLDEWETARLLATAGIDLPRMQPAATAEEAVAAAEALGFPVVIKVRSPDIPHKSDIGGVVLGIDSAGAAAEAHTAILASARRHLPDARLAGTLVVQQMGGGVEFVLGSAQDPTFGVVVLLGAGGVLAELLGDVTIRRAPVDAATAGDMLDALKVSALLAGFRGRRPADRAALVRSIVAFSELAAALDGVATLEINPLLATEAGCFALDALLVRSG